MKYYLEIEESDYRKVKKILRERGQPIAIGVGEDGECDYITADDVAYGCFNHFPIGVINNDH